MQSAADRVASTSGAPSSPKLGGGVELEADIRVSRQGNICPWQDVMTLARLTFLVAMAACTASAALAQEQAAPSSIQPDRAEWQKQCEDKANHDKLAENLRSTFMLECVANARLNTPQGPPGQK
jgi:hypothetical protein